MLTRFASTRRTIDGVLFASSLGALVLLRSSFHIVLMVLILVIVWRQLRLDASTHRGHRGRAACWWSGAWSVKNVLVFDSWTNSTWVGMNLSYVAHAGVTHAECERLVARRDGEQRRRVVPRFADRRHTRTVSPPDAYGAAATDRLYKSTGQPNFNASLYIDVASQYQQRLDRAAPSWRRRRDRTRGARGVHGLGATG